MKKQKNTIKSIYSEIRDQLFKMIPEKWESIYLYASVIENKNKNENGEMFFYYYPKSLIKKNPINVYEVPSKFNINEQEYMKLAIALYDLIKKLRHMCIEIDNIVWSNITISIENVEFLAEYNLDDLTKNNYSIDDRRIIWQHKYLNYPLERMDKREREVVNRYLQEEEWGEHRTTIYSETFYQKHIHNDVKYNEEVKPYEEPEEIVEYIEDTANEQQNIVNENVVVNQLLKFNK